MSSTPVTTDAQADIRSQLTSPFPDEQLAALWQWIHEFPGASSDDYFPRSLEEFLPHIRQRLESERSWGLFKDGRCCAAIAFVPVTPRLGFFHGICFAKGYCSSQEKRWVVRAVLDELFASGIEKVCAEYFADNSKIAKFLADLGAVQEGTLRRHTLRGGVPIDMIQVAIFKDAIR